MLLFQRTCTAVICNRSGEAALQPQRRGVSDLVVTERRSATHQAQRGKESLKSSSPLHVTRRRTRQLPSFDGLLGR